MDLQSLARQAVAFHQQGDLGQAESLYLQILEADPALFGPRYYLGTMRLQQGRNAEAADLLGQALQILPEDLGALMNYGMALRVTGRPAEALDAFERALKIQPNMVEALFNRGIAQADLARYELALESYDRVLELKPGFAPALLNRGVALSTLNRMHDALTNYDRMLAIQPDSVVAMNARGLTLRALGRIPEALESYERAIALNPPYADARYNRAVVLMDLQRAPEALAAFEDVMAIRPDDAELLNNRGVALWNLKRPAEAMASYERALTIEPDFAEAWGNRGLALRDLARLPEALASFEHLLTLKPRNPVAWNSRGTVLRDMKKYDEAIESYGRAIEIRPDYAEALNNRGYTYWTNKHEYAPALADLERALALDPGHPYARGEILHIRMYGADWKDYAAEKARIETGIREGKRVARPFMAQGVLDQPADLQACSRIYAQDLYPLIEAPRHDPATRRGGSKIRLGYLSGEFREQATAILMAGLYELHDRDRFEVIAIDNGGSDASAMRARLEKAFDGFVDIGGLSDEDAATKIRDAKIDILINLNGYFGSPRMGVFARRPAPLQVNYLGFPATLGAPYLDYILADAVVIPSDEQRFYDEKVVTLPGSYQVNDARGRAIAATPTRAQAGLPDGAFVFCNFNQSYKLTPGTFASWMRILKQVEGSVLWLLSSQPPFAENLAREAQAAGIDPTRVLFAPDLPPDQHLARLQLADLFLDTLPYNAHTTGSDALWAGVPMVTQRGTAFAGRVAASLLNAAGLPELVTQSAAEYEALAIKLAKDTSALIALKDRLAKNRATCALFDTDLFRRNIETAYDTMWKAWLAGEAPKAFSV